MTGESKAVKEAASQGPKPTEPPKDDESSRSDETREGSSDESGTDPRPAGDRGGVTFAAEEETLSHYRKKRRRTSSRTIELKQAHTSETAEARIERIRSTSRGSVKYTPTENSGTPQRVCSKLENGRMTNPKTPYVKKVRRKTIEMADVESPVSRGEGA